MDLFFDSQQISSLSVFIFLLIKTILRCFQKHCNQVFIWQLRFINSEEDLTLYFAIVVDGFWFNNKVKNQGKKIKVLF